MCNGSESHISECNYTISNSCTRRYVYVYCTAYPLNITDIRLNSTISSRQGRVEIEVGGEWGTVCEDSFGPTDALVVCRMLGFNISYSNVLYYGRAYFGPGSGQIFVDDLACSGDEYHLNECYYIPEHNCGHYDDVSVICSEHPFNIRLNSTVSSRQGRVEVEVGGEWGTVCDYSFGPTDALVVCRMLGFNVSYSNILYFRNAYFGQGNGAIIYSNLACSGDEFHLSECNYSPAHYYCGHQEDVSVICFEDLDVTDARLVNGTGPFDGRAEIKVNGTWGTICDQNFDILYANAFCDILGKRATQYFTSARYGQGSGIMYTIFCSSSYISSCRYEIADRCTHEQDASVVCNDCGEPDNSHWGVDYFSINGSTLYADCSYYKSYVGTLTLTCNNETNQWVTEGECREYSYPLAITNIRLVGGESISRGRVELYSMDTWGTVCDHAFGMNEAEVICSMAGFPGAIAFYPGAHFGEGSGPIFVDDLNCDENATHINNCSYVTYDDCSHSNDVSVVCTGCGNAIPSNGYSNSTMSNEGAVIRIYCNENYNLIGDSIITCQDGAWNDQPTCKLIDCGDPTPENGFRNESDSTNGAVVNVWCKTGYTILGNAIIICQANESWTDSPVCEINDCGLPEPENAVVTLYNNKTTYGENAVVSCIHGYIPAGSLTVSCLENGTWEEWPACELIDCGDPTPERGSRNSSDSTYGSLVFISCETGYNISGNATIICQGDGTWSDIPVCDASDCGLLSVPNGNVNTSQGTSVGSIATIECDNGYDLNGSSIATCTGTGERADWNYSSVCELQVCSDPTPSNGRTIESDGTKSYVFGNTAKIECNTGYELKGDNLITCNNGGLWSGEPTCDLFDCGPPTAPTNGDVDDTQGTKYNAEIRFICDKGFLLVGEEYSVCGANGEWSNDAPACVAKSAAGGYCQNKDYCLLEDSSCINSVCTCITGIYDTRTNKCDTMPLMPFGTDEGDIAIPKTRSICGPKVSFAAGFPIYGKMHTDLYVCSFGYVSFDTQFSNPTSPSNRRAVKRFGQKRLLLAPFYAPIDRRKSGPVFYRTYHILNIKEFIDNTDIISNIENIVRKFGNLDLFHASFILIATWYEQIPARRGFDQTKTATFQVVLASDGKSTYAFYIYGNGMMNWVNNLSTRPPIWIGETVDTLTYSHPLAFSNAAFRLDVKLTVSKSERDVSGLVVRSLNTQGKKHENAAVDCIRWYNDNYKEKQRIAYIASIAPKCPCDIRLSRFDPWFWMIGLYRWHRYLNYKCVDMLHVGNFGHYGKSCCYDLKTWLLIYERPLAGNFHLYNSRHPSEHILNDVEPKTKCCVLSNYCHLYYELRPTGLCYKTSPYNFGTFWGDPHFSTLDGMNFTFNGLGEYTLLRINTDTCNFDLQARTERTLKEDGNLSDATVFAAFAAKDSTNSSVHVERNKKRNGINLYGNGADLTEQYNSNTNETDPFVWSSSDNNLTITKRNGSVDVYFPICNISLIISINIEMLTLRTLVPDNLQNLTNGLLGNYNGDSSDDFTMPNGTVLQENITEREIFSYGQTWAINPNNSAFVYDDGKSHFDFQNETYVPRFLDEADPELIAKAEKICDGSNNTECVFDYVFTEKPDIAEETKKVKGQSDADKVEIDEIVPTLEGCSTVNVTKGQKASCKLNVGEGDSVKIVSSNVSAEIDQESSTITFVPETDEPVTIRVMAENKNGRFSPTFAVSVLLCTACNGHGVCTGVPRSDARETEYFHYFACECDPEYEGIDCENEFDGCAANPCSLDRNCSTLTAEEQIQRNRSYVCDPCPTGFEDDDDDECIDIDECEVNNGGCDQNCTNTDGSFECTCKSGYRVDSRDSSACKDINECEEAMHNCDHICNNTEGDFTCQCFAGYELNTTSQTCHQTSDGSCTDMEKNMCSNAHGCTKEDNKSVCFCKDGYDLDSAGVYCQVAGLFLCYLKYSK
ncbi:uncharacterized protein LOC123541978 [Mercenaria mercenaria]|uniref:uncharacterized protein LOC123541978 n=1 Tax=Mercenaria mercenaria TaxID=6596 RepID=UPI00234F12C6|nr:uncharacterized protein LOC123541978 [Mercenaria mercenaria]